MSHASSFVKSDILQLSKKQARNMLLGDMCNQSRVRHVSPTSIDSYSHYSHPIITEISTRFSLNVDVISPFLP